MKNVTLSLTLTTFISLIAIAVGCRSITERQDVRPLVLRDDEVLVRWSPAQPDALTPLDAYLRDRVDLLVHPPEGT